MLTQVGAYCKQLTKNLDVLVKNPIAFRHFIQALSYSGASWKQLVKYEGRGSVQRHNRINRLLKGVKDEQGNEVQILHANTLMVGKRFHIIKNNPGQLLANQSLIREAYVSNGRTDTEFLFYWEMLCVMSFANWIFQNFPQFRRLLKGKKRPQQELMALGSSFGGTVRDNYVALFAN